MSASPVTMEELELERAELLPNRETLCSGGSYHPGHSSASPRSATATPPSPGW